MYSPVREDYKVVQSNLLIATRKKMTLQQQKLFRICIAAINTKDDNHPNYVILKKKEILALFNYKSSSANSVIRKALESLMDIDTIEIKGKNSSITGKIHLIPNVFWGGSVKGDSANSLKTVAIDDDLLPQIQDDEVYVEFNEKVMPQLVGLREDFSQYELYNSQGFSSEFSIGLFENLIAKRNSTYKNIIEWDLSTIKYFLGIDEDKYTDYRNFNRKILKVAVKDVNKVSDIWVNYEPIKNGTKIVGIRFYTYFPTAIERYTITNCKQRQEIVMQKYKKEYISKSIKNDKINAQNVFDVNFTEEDITKQNIYLNHQEVDKILGINKSEEGQLYDEINEVIFGEK